MQDPAFLTIQAALMFCAAVTHEAREHSEACFPSRPETGADDALVELEGVVKPREAGGAGKYSHWVNEHGTRLTQPALFSATRLPQPEGTKSQRGISVREWSSEEEEGHGQ